MHFGQSAGAVMEFRFNGGRLCKPSRAGFQTRPPFHSAASTGARAPKCMTRATRVTVSQSGARDAISLAAASFRSAASPRAAFLRFGRGTGARESFVPATLLKSGVRTRRTPKALRAKLAPKFVRRARLAFHLRGLWMTPVSSRAIV